MFDVESDDLGHPQARAVEHLEQGLVAQTDSAFALRPVDHRPDVLDRQRDRQLATELGPADQRDLVLGDQPLAPTELAKAAQRRQLAADRAGLEIAVQLGERRPNLADAQIADRGRARPATLDPSREVFDIVGVGPKGVGRESPLGLEVDQKPGEGFAHAGRVTEATRQAKFVIIEAVAQPQPPSQEDTIARGLDEDATLAGESPRDDGDQDPRALLAGQTRLGHHVLLDVLGQGGMGIVYAAFDEKLDRKVAIKVLWTRGGELVQRRLAREAQAMARLSHPNVVQIYEIGEHRTMAFLVMQYVDGVTLRHWLAERPQPRAQILATFVAAGRGLAAAHAQGLVHRDFKPDNVMIRRADGQVLVMDFGLARGDAALDSLDPSPLDPLPGPALGTTLDRANELSQQLTQAGTLTGTPRYMAPEQFECRETDARTDQFSFCVALWEALYGQRPFQGDNLAALTLAVTEGKWVEPDKGDIPTWLRRVLERGLARDPGARWPTMAALLAALESDPTRRRKLTLAGVGVLALGLASVVGVQIVRTQQRDAAIAECLQDGQSITRDWNDAVATRLEQTFLGTGARYASSAWSHTQTWMDDYAQTWSELRTRTCQEARVEQTRSRASLDAVTACLDQRRATFVGLLAAWANADLKTMTRAPLAAAGLPPISTCTTELRASEPPPAAIREQVAALDGRIEQVDAMRLIGDFQAGLTLALAIQAEAEQLEWLPSIAQARLTVASMQLKLGDYPEARRSAEAAFLAALRSNDDLTMQAAATTLTYLVGYALGEFEQGRYWGQIGAELIQRLELTGTLRETTLLEDTGLVYTADGQFATAADYHRRALAIATAVLGPDHPDVASARINLGGALAGQGDYAGAREHFERAIEIKQAAFGPDHPDVATAIGNIGIMQMRQGQYADALITLNRALALHEAALGSEHPRVANTLSNLGNLQNAMGQPEAATVSVDRALAIYTSTLGPDHPQSIGALNNLGLVKAAQGEDEQALGYFRKALAITEAAVGIDHPDAAGSLINIGDVLLERGDASAARESYELALAAVRTTPDHPWVGLAMSGIGLADLELADLTSASDWLARALPSVTKAEDPLELARTRFALARLALARLDPIEAGLLAAAARADCVEAGKLCDRLLARIDAWAAG